MKIRSMMLMCMMILGLSQAANAAVGDREAAVLKCVDHWMETIEGVPQGQTSRYYNSSMMNLSGPHLLFFRSSVTKCLTEKKWRVGDTNTVGHFDQGTPLMELAVQFSMITSQ